MVGPQGRVADHQLQCRKPGLSLTLYLFLSQLHTCMFCKLSPIPASIIGKLKEHKGLRDFLKNEIYYCQVELTNHKLLEAPEQWHLPWAHWVQ